MNDDNPSKEQPSRRFSVASVLLFGLPVAFVILSTLAFLMAKDRMPKLSEWEFEAAALRWEESRRADYDMDIEVGGATPGLVKIKVRNGNVDEMQRDGQTPKNKRTWDTWTVEGQFEMLDRELDIAEDPAREIGAPTGTTIELRAQFDPHFGHPVGFQRLVLRGDVPEVEWHVVRFELK